MLNWLARLIASLSDRLARLFDRTLPDHPEQQTPAKTDGKDTFNPGTWDMM